jgi:hypothetical protein
MKQSETMKKTIPALLLGITLAVLSLGCDSNNGTVEPNAGMAELKVAHLSPDAGPVDVWLDGAVVLTSRSFETISGYLAIEAGDRRVQVTPAGQTTPLVIDAVLPIAAGTATTVAATGLLAAMDVQAIVLPDDRNAGSQVQVRFVHASPDAPPVDVALTGGPVLIGNTAFREASAYTTVAGGTYDLEVRLAGTPTVALSLPGTVLTNGTNITVFAVGEVGNGTLGALVELDGN